MHTTSSDRQGELLGYTDHPVVAPGGKVRLAVSASAGAYDLQLVRLIHADANPLGPGFKEREIDCSINGRRAGTAQRAKSGSYAQIDDRRAFEALQSFTISLFIAPTTPAKAGGQVLFARLGADGRTGGGFGLDDEGRLVAWSGDELVLQGAKLRARAWTWIVCSFDAASGTLRMLQRPCQPIPTEAELALSEGPASFNPAAAGSPVTLAASLAGEHTRRHFNGRMEAVSVWEGSLAPDELRSLEPGGDFNLPLVARWNFGREVHSSRLVDEGPYKADGRLLQAPARAVPGRNWTGREVDFRRAPDEYGAVHFHDDDVGDNGWDFDVTFQVPADLPSGVYAFRLRAGDLEDHVPFFVRPFPGQPTARIALLMPTFSYLAYANERISAGVDFVAAGMTDRELAFGPEDEVLHQRPEFGVSMYDHHSDGSGVIHSSWRRPILNLRPRYRWWLSGAPQYLGCDLYIVAWLEHLGQPYDVITDHCVDAEGEALLSQYQVVITSSHPEYMSYAMMTAFERYTASGGRLMYLGGNGFYWVTSLCPDSPHIIEVRRGMAGTRAWESAPGEEHHSSTGERGGLWRHRGLSPNRLTGIGFAAQGWSRQSPGYQVSAAARQNPRTAWIFQGVNEDVIGDFGLIMGGAAGDELDRADVLLGTPDHAVVLASSSGHGRYYLQVHEDVPFSHAGLTGDLNPNVRADVTFFETSGDGAVFSVGSKAWAGSLSWNGYDNNVARLTATVLNGFLERSFNGGAR